MSRFNKNPELVVSLAANIALIGLVGYLALKNRQSRYEATHDNLTGALNTRGLEELLAQNKPPKAMLYVDGTNQKAVNDTISHDRGDEAIIGTAIVLKKSLRPSDILARIGGDEFLVLLDTERRSDEDPLSPDQLLAAVIPRVDQETQVFLGNNPDLVGAGFNIAVGGATWQMGMSVVDMKSVAEQDMNRAKQEQHQVDGRYRP
jgi:diguanylate cyclase (GGDEF)-like protein